MWKFRAVSEDSAKIRKNKEKVESVIKELDSLLVSVADVDSRLYRYIADARKYAEDLKRSLEGGEDGRQG